MIQTFRENHKRQFLHATRKNEFPESRRILLHCLRTRGSLSSTILTEWVPFCKSKHTDNDFKRVLSLLALNSDR